MNEPAPPKTPALWALLAINIVVYVLWQTWGLDHLDWMRANFLVSAEGVGTGRVWTLLTSAFSHVDPMHLLFNMFALYVFGQPVHRVLGSAGFTALYIVGGLAGSTGFVAWNLHAGLEGNALGASGAVMAVAVPYGFLFPKRTLLLNFFIPVPAWLAVVLFIGMDVGGLFGHNPFGMTEAPIAHAAHLGGAVVGLLVGAAVRFRRTRAQPRDQR